MQENENQICFNAITVALQVVNGKWAFLVISLLFQHPHRFNQLRRNLDNISIKSLTDILRQLEQQQIIRRQVFPTVPITVEYSLTEKGREYKAVLSQMREWGEKWSGSENK